MTEPTLQDRLLAWEHESPALGPVIREAAARLVELERGRDAWRGFTRAAEMDGLTARAALEARLALAEEVVKAARLAHDHHGSGGGPFSRPTPIPLSECSDPRCLVIAAYDAAKEKP